MKILPYSLLASFVSLLFAPLAPAAEVQAGPRGGRLLDATPHRAELFVNAERHVEVTFYDEALKVVAPTSQAVTVTAQPAGGATALAMQATPQGFVSAQPLPPGDPYRLVVQIRATPEARPTNFRVDLNLATCGECSRPEYACTCPGH